MRLICAVLMTLISGMATVQGDFKELVKNGSAKVELAWELDNKTYYKWDVSTWDNKAKADRKPKSAQYIHFMGYELDEFGIVNRVHQPYQYYELAFQFAAYLPNKKKRQGSTWEKTWELDHNSIGDANFKSNYLFVGAVKIDGVECMQIDGTHKWGKNLNENPLNWNSAEIETKAYFDPSKKMIVGWDVTTDTSTGNEAKPLIESYSASWRLKVERDSTSERYLRGRVNSAIVRGVERLWKEQNSEGMFGNWPERDRGHTGLALLALLMCGEDPDDDRIKKGIEAMKATEMGDIYQVAVTIMAIEAKYIPDAEKESFLKGDKVKEFKRDVSKEDRQHVQECLDWILKNQNKENDFWNYYYNKGDNKTRFDFSITQYAALGISAALRMGHKLPAGYVRGGVTSTIEHQMPEGPKVRTVREHKPGSRKDRTTYASKPTEARGWEYMKKGKWDKYSEKTNAYGSMTCAGLATLLCGLDNAAQMDRKAWAQEFKSQKKHLQWKAAGEESLRGGNAWLERWFSITRNPNKGRTHYYYYLYSLERIAMMQDIKYIGVHDWYWEGAAALVELQDEDGQWNGEFIETSFALLFLKRGTVRIQSVTTGSN